MEKWSGVFFAFCSFFKKTFRKNGDNNNVYVGIVRRLSLGLQLFYIFIALINGKIVHKVMTVYYWKLCVS